MTQINEQETAVAGSGDPAGLVKNFDPANPPLECYDNPYPVYHALREHDPVHRCPNGSYFLTR